MHQTIGYFKQAAGQKDKNAHRVQEPGADHGHARPGKGPDQTFLEAQQTLGHRVAHHGSVQIVVGLTQTAGHAGFFLIDPVVDHIVQGIDGGITGENRDEAKKGNV